MSPLVAALSRANLVKPPPLTTEPPILADRGFAVYALREEPKLAYLYLEETGNAGEIPVTSDE
jgi:hypothetical protein